MNVELGLVFGRPRNDERRARLVDQDRVDLVDDRVGVAALGHRRDRILHVVAQIVEAEFVVRAVGHVTGVGGAAFFVGEAVHDAADAETEELVDLSHPLGVALGEIVVDGNDMHTFAGERVQVDGQGGNERFAFARLHLSDLALVQNHAADELHVEMPLSERALGGFADGGEGFGEDVFERLVPGKAVLEDLGHRLQLGVGLRLELVFQRVDFRNRRPHTLELAVIGRAKEPLCERAETQHKFLVRMPETAGRACKCGVPAVAQR